MKRTYKHFLQDIIDYAESAENFIKGLNFKEFEEDKKTYFAVIRALEVIGEAIRYIPEEIKKKYQEIPWPQIVGFRNTVIHEYFGIDKKIVWDTVKNDIPFLKNAINRILEDEYKENHF